MNFSKKYRDYSPKVKYLMKFNKVQVQEILTQGIERRKKKVDEYTQKIEREIISPAEKLKIQRIQKKQELRELAKKLKNQEKRIAILHENLHLTSNKNLGILSKKEPKEKKKLENLKEEKAKIKIIKSTSKSLVKEINQLDNELIKVYESCPNKVIQLKLNKQTIKYFENLKLNLDFPNNKHFKKKI